MRAQKSLIVIVKGYDNRILIDAQLMNLVRSDDDFWMCFYCLNFVT